MTISYEVRDIIKILLKRWYVILAVGAVFSLIAKPLSDASYQRALQQYNDNTNLELLIAQAKSKSEPAPAEAPIEDLLPSKSNNVEEPIELVTGRAYFNVILPNYITSGENAEQYTENMMLNISNFSYNNSFLIPLFNSIADDYKGSNFNSFKASFVFAPIKGTDILEVTCYKINKDAFESFLEKYPNAISSFMNSLLYDGFNLNIIKTDYDQKPVTIESKQKEDIISDSDKAILNEAVKKLAFNRMILKEPTIQSSQIKLMGSSALFGVLLACAVLLIIDYIKSCRKIEMKEYPH